MKSIIYLYTLVWIGLIYSPVPAQLIPLASIDSIKTHINYLGSDMLQGRATGSDGLKEAAGYISNSMNKYRLHANGQNNRWYQKVPMHGTRPLSISTLQVHYNNENKYLLYEKDFILIKSGSEAFPPGLLPIVFVGYGISAPSFEYDDYNNIDVNGKIVVFLNGEPPSNDLEYFASEEKTIFSLYESKIRIAIAKGAAGSILIYDEPHEGNKSWEKKKSEYSFEEVTLPNRVTGHLAIMLNPKNAELFFKGTGHNYKELIKQRDKNILSSFPLKVSAAFNASFKSREFKSQNILASIKGRDSLLSNEYLIIGAHYDHLGIGSKVSGDSIYNGVLDNATGVAVVMELARIFSSADFQPKRSILFAFFTGEESGLLGSYYYTLHPQVVINKTIAMVNIDGLSTMGNFKSIIPVGGNYSDLGIILSEVANEYGISIEQLNTVGYGESFFKSDQLSFARAGIPSIQVIEGYEYPFISKEEALARTRLWFKKIYHSPFDDMDQDIDFKSIARYTNFMVVFCNRILNMERKPQWYQDSPYRRE